MTFYHHRLTSATEEYKSLPYIDDKVKIKSRGIACPHMNMNVALASFALNETKGLMMSQ